MYLRCLQIEREDRQDGQPVFHECARLRQTDAAEPVRAVQDLGRGDGGDAHRIVGAVSERRLEVQPAALGRDEDTGVDQRPHGAEGTSARFQAATPASTAFR